MSGCGCRSRSTPVSCWPGRSAPAWHTCRAGTSRFPGWNRGRCDWFLPVWPRSRSGKAWRSWGEPSPLSWRTRRGISSLRPPWCERRGGAGFSLPTPACGRVWSAKREENDMFQFSSEQFRLKVGLAEMLKGGVIMHVTNAEQAKIAEDAGASAVMALERVPSDIRKEGGVARMANIEIMEAIMKTVHIPVMAKARIGHFMEARILEALGVDFIDESEVLTPADEEHHIDKNDFKVPFVCGARNLGEALRRIGEGAAMIRTKGEAGSGNIVEAVRHIRTIVREMKQLTVLGKEGLARESKKGQAPR